MCPNMGVNRNFRTRLSTTVWMVTVPSFAGATVGSGSLPINGKFPLSGIV